MTRPADPVDGVPESHRWTTSQNRYEDLPIEHRGPAGTYRYKPVTLEEEAAAGGWLPGARPTGPEPIRLYTTSMRGEPGWDDDPSPAPDGVGYAHTPPHVDVDNSSYD